MNPLEKVRSIFLECLNLPEEERNTFLDSSCGEDTELRAEVESLLQTYGKHDDVVDDFLTTDLDSAFRTLINERSGEKVGHYLIKEKIGEGSVGVVYRAEQLEPIKREVAVKVIKLGMDTLEVIERFEAERQALAMMDHPNIAKVFEAGSTGQGRPFFVMELVRGIPLSKYCDQNNLDIDRRLEVFIRICQGVQHAHLKGVVHRDLKPANILVATSDGMPDPKIIDFGIAKAIEGRLGDRTLKTSIHAFVGTPLYTSPEQARIGITDVDTRSDIYSLGVILFELLAGRLPFDAGDLEVRDSARSISGLQSFEVRTPSSALKTMEQEKRLNVAAKRATSLRRHMSQLKGDLEWIIMQCLEEDRSRRYQTANALAMDLERYLKGDPVTACPPTKSYLLKKFTRRHKLGLFATGAITASLLVGFWTSIQALQRERLARVEADEEANHSAQVTRFMVGMLDGVGPQVALGADTTLLRQILAQTETRLLSDPKPSPEVEAELRETLGKLHFDLGNYDAAVAMHNISLELRQTMFGQESLEVTQSLIHLGRAYAKNGLFKDSEGYLRKALVMRRNILGSDHLDVAAACDELCNTLLPFDGGFALRGDNIEEAQSLRRESSRIMETVYGKDSPQYARSLLRLAKCINRGFYSSPADQKGKVEALFREALGIFRSNLGNKNPEVAITLLYLGIAVSSWEEADLLIAEGFSILEAMPATIDMKLAADLAPMVWYVGWNPERRDFSEKVLIQLLAIQEKLFAKEHPDIARTLYYLGGLRVRSQKNTDAETSLKASLAMTERLLGENHISTIPILSSLAIIAGRLGKLDEAREILQAWLERQRTLTSDGHIYVSMSTAPMVTLESDQRAWMESAFLEVLALRQRHLGNEHFAVGRALEVLGRLMSRHGRIDEAKSFFWRGAQVYKNAPFADHKAAGMLMDFGIMSFKTGDYSGAEKAYREAIQLSPNTNLRAWWDGWLAQVLEIQGKISELQALLDKELVRLESGESNDPNISYNYRRALIEWFKKQNDLTRVDQIFQDGMALARERFDKPSEFDARYFLTLVDELILFKRPTEAEAFARECIATLQDNRPESTMIYLIQSLLGRAILNQRKYAEAETFLLNHQEAIPTMPRSVQNSVRNYTVDDLSRLYTERDRP